jgi:predicted alpha/beta-fold hydrolase
LRYNLSLIIATVTVAIRLTQRFKTVAFRSFERSRKIDRLRQIVDRFPSFEPHALLRNRHLQTIAGAIFTDRLHPYRAVAHRVLLSDGDRTVLHDDRPPNWQPTAPTAILVHGLTGCHLSPYMVHAAARLNTAGVRTFRMDMRSCGAAQGVSSMPYHAGCSGDLLSVVQHVSRLCPGSPINLVGYSIGGNVVLKMAGEFADRLPAQVRRLAVVSPPIDLRLCVDRFSRGRFRFYDRFIAMANRRHVRRTQLLVNNTPHLIAALRSGGQRDFDDGYTSTVWGFDSVEQFYNNTSSRHVVRNVRIPTLLIASRDDPLVPVELFKPLRSQPSIALHLTDHGGHLGFIGQQGADEDRRWMSWRIVDFLTAQTAAARIAA